MEFIHDDFLLHSDTARQLYHNYAAESRSWIIIRIFHQPTLPATGGSMIYRRSGWRAIITNGEPCGPTELTSAIVPAMQPLMENFWPGPERFRLLCGTRSTIGLILN